MSTTPDLRFWDGEPLPASLARLREASRQEGFRHLDRLEVECFGAGVVFAPKPACLGFAFMDGTLVGIGGMTADPYDPASFRLRMRHFYVAPEYRRNGIARVLAERLIAGLSPAITHLTLRTHLGATQFWEALGFEPATHPSRSHERVLYSLDISAVADPVAIR